MKPKLPGLPTFSALMLSAVLAVWLGVWGPINLETVGRWQTLIGGMITAAGVLGAAWNVTRQIRLTARLREEDRIESDLPGLNAAFVFLNRFKWQLERNVSRDFILKTLADSGQTDSGPNMLADIERLLPVAKDQLRRDLADKIILLRTAIKIVSDSERFHRESMMSVDHVSETDPARSDEAHNLVGFAHQSVMYALREYDAARRDLIGFYDELIERIENGRARLHELRAGRERVLKLRS